MTKWKGVRFDHSPPGRHFIATHHSANLGQLDCSTAGMPENTAAENGTTDDDGGKKKRETFLPCLASLEPALGIGTP